VRIQAQLQKARQLEQTTGALDTFGQGMIAIKPESGHFQWRTPLAQKLLAKYLSCESDIVPETLEQWVRQYSGDEEMSSDTRAIPLHVVSEERRLTLTLQKITEDGDWLIALREEDDALTVAALAEGLNLTQREAEVLYWVVRGKISRDIADILGASIRTINKHLEHIFQKLGVETRTAAAAKAMNWIRLMLPSNP
jgi:DNA-binding CsgD family transcriptional regulator